MLNIFNTLLPIFNRYDKREDLSPTSPAMQMYSHLLMEANATKIELLQDTHQPLTFIEGYRNIAFSVFHFPPVRVHLERKTVLMERKATKTETWTSVGFFFFKFGDHYCETSAFTE